MATRSKKALGQHRDNRSASVPVTPPPGRLIVTGHPPIVTTSSSGDTAPGQLAVAGYAPTVETLHQLARRGEHMLARQAPEWRAQWGADLEAIITALRREGRPRSKRDQAFEYIDEQVRRGRCVSPALKVEAADYARCSLKTVVRALAERRK